ncbi:hypothetical protein BDV32DRAFT_132914 [Aspergillus pseudonomiae]|nr:hypothetical protein BDV32DRAFT_132914 [Aspergillus pseudonomiae]
MWCANIVRYTHSRGRPVCMWAMSGLIVILTVAISSRRATDILPLVYASVKLLPQYF